MLSDEQKAELKEAEDWNRKRVIAVTEWMRTHQFSIHPLLDNEEIEIQLASAFNAGARWERDRPC